MHKIDGAGAAPGGQFTEGSPTAGVPATVVTDDWLNAVQGELVALVEGAGIALSKPVNTQVLAAVLTLIGRGVPVGQVIQGYFSAAPAGFLLCNGALVSRATYPALYAHAVAAGVITSEIIWATGGWTLFGVGDGAATFRLPDLRAEFIRGADLGRGVDAGRGMGSWQGDAFRAHSHDMGVEAGGGGNFATPVDSSGVDETQAGNPTSTVGGAETRPRNAALAFCVRF